MKVLNKGSKNRGPGKSTAGPAGGSGVGAIGRGVPGGTFTRPYRSIGGMRVHTLKPGLLTIATTMAAIVAGHAA